MPTWCSSRIAVNFFLILCVASFPVAANPLSAESKHRVYVIVHGAGGGGWSWKSVGWLLTLKGHTVYRPTLTGLGEKVHLATADTDLTTHINDIANLIRFEKLNDIVLVGHSYGGIVITGVMDLMPEHIGHAIFLDAPVPDDGMAGVDIWKSLMEKSHIENGKLYFPWLVVDSPYPHEVAQPIKTFTEPVSYNNPEAMDLPVTFVAFIHPGQTEAQRALDPSWKRAESRHWLIRTFNSDHNAYASHPEELAKLLNEIPGN